MRIGILGVGHIGKTLARTLAAAGHDVKVANSRGPESIGGDVLSTGARPATAEEAADGVEVLITSVPFKRVPELAEVVQAAPLEAVVIDTSNYYPSRDGRIDAVENGLVETLWVAEHFGRTLAKAWNAIDSDAFARGGRPGGTPGRLAIPVAADDLRARDVAMALVEDTGFDAYYSGSLADSWRQQPGAPSYCTQLTLAELPDALEAADRSRLAIRRDLALSIVYEKIGDISTKQADAEFLMRVNRLIYL